MSGEITPELGNLANLTELGLRKNLLSGWAPSGHPSASGMPFCQ